MTYIQQFRFAQDQQLLDSTQQAILVAADSVILEVNTTPNHANRLTLAHNVKTGPERYTALFTQSIVSDGSIAPGTVTDAQILARVQAVWDSIAGTV